MAVNPVAARTVGVGAFDAFFRPIPNSPANFFVSSILAPDTNAITGASLAVKHRLLTICATSQPIASAAACAVRASVGNSTTSMDKPAFRCGSDDPLCGWIHYVSAPDSSSCPVMVGDQRLHAHCGSADKTSNIIANSRLRLLKAANTRIALTKLTVFIERWECDDRYSSAIGSRSKVLAADRNIERRTCLFCAHKPGPTAMAVKIDARRR